MKEKIKILVGFRLSDSQKKALKNGAIQYDEIPLISVKQKTVNYSLNENDICVITSINAAKAIESSVHLNKCRLFTFSPKVYNYFTKRDIKIERKDSNSANELISGLTNTYPKNNITYFCGNLSNKLIDERFHKHVQFIETYETSILKPTIEGNYNGVVLISPSAVKSLVESNYIPDENVPIFTIGRTTQQIIAENFSNYIIVSKQQTTDSVITSILNFYQKQ